MEPSIRRPIAVRRSTPLLAVAAVLALLLAGARARAESRSLELDPATTRVSFDVGATGHDVHGSIGLAEGEVTFDPSDGEASGSVRLRLDGASTGNRARDRKMLEEVFEAARFPDLEFRPRRIEGLKQLAGRQEIALEGTLLLHGTPHEVRWTGSAEFEGERVLVSLRFPVPYVDWGLEDPGLFVLRVADVVQVAVEAHGTLRATAGSSAGSGGR